jgi:hypothetical protein
MKKVKITKIKENNNHPGIIYGELREVGTNNLLTASTLEYIFNRLREDNNLDCINAAKDKFGNFSIFLFP